MRIRNRIACPLWQRKRGLLCWLFIIHISIAFFPVRMFESQLSFDGKRNWYCPVVIFETWSLPEEQFYLSQANDSGFMEPDCYIFLNRKSPNRHFPGPWNDYNRKIIFTNARTVIKGNWVFKVHKLLYSSESCLGTLVNKYFHINAASDKMRRV